MKQIIMIVWVIFNNPLIGKCNPGGLPACENNGICSITENGEIHCECLKYYNGSRCEKGTCF